MLDHRACVDAMMERAGHQLPADRLIRLFQAAFDAVWQRALVTLGTVTLTAIVDRVLYNALERHPVLAALELGGDGIDCGALARRRDGLARQPLADGLREVLVEVLAVIGSLTAEILTPALHAALAAVPDAGGISEPDDASGGERTHDR